MRKSYLTFVAVVILSVITALFLVSKNVPDATGVIMLSPQSSSTFISVPKVRFIPITPKSKFKADISNAAKRSNQKAILQTI